MLKYIENESQLISIHAARVGCDSAARKEYQDWKLISIHAARVGCDERDARGGTRYIISIHAARVGCDGTFLPAGRTLYDFNPRSPSGLRPD